MERELNELKQLMKDLLYELSDVKERVLALETLIGGEKDVTMPTLTHRAFEVSAEGYANLGRLYRQGYHICPHAYGHLRVDDDECLFCVAMLEKK
ncbi:MAG: initiation control protein YabA [Methylocystaceae bacterium]